MAPVAVTQPRNEPRAIAPLRVQVQNVTSLLSIGPTNMVKIKAANTTDQSQHQENLAFSEVFLWSVKGAAMGQTW